MSVWKIGEEGPIKLTETQFKEEKVLEENLEDWVVTDSSLLGEPLLVIGRQVMIPEVKDRLDILALDPQGNAVVIELKRGKLKDPVDMQALRYASYVSKWRFEDFERQARAYLGKSGDPEFNFNELFEQCCTDEGIDEIPNINSDQRLVIVGSEVKDKLGSVALWLLDHNIDIKVIEVEIYKEGNSIFVQPQTIIPLPVSRFAVVGGTLGGEGKQPWVTDGKTWHLEKRCNPETRELLLKLNDMVTEKFEVNGPLWNQKNYIAYRVGNYTWLFIITGAKVIRLNFTVKAGAFKQADLAKKLSVEEFDKEEPLADKLGLPSSVSVQNRNPGTDRVILRIKQDFDLDSEPFADLLDKAYKAFQKK